MTIAAFRLFIEPSCAVICKEVDTLRSRWQTHAPLCTANNALKICLIFSEKVILGMLTPSFIASTAKKFNETWEFSL